MSMNCRINTYQLNFEQMDALTAEEKEKNIEKMKFCIISCHKSQLSKSRLLMFALENRY